MFPTSELKTSGPSLEGCRRCSLPSTAQANLGEAGREAPGEETPRKKKSAPICAKIFLQVGRGVGRCAAKTAGGSGHHPPSTAARSKCAKSRSHQSAWWDVDQTRRGPSPD